MNWKETNFDELISQMKEEVKRICNFPMKPELPTLLIAKTTLEKLNG